MIQIFGCLWHPYCSSFRYGLESIMCSSMTTLHANMHAILQFSMISVLELDGAELIRLKNLVAYGARHLHAKFGTWVRLGIYYVLIHDNFAFKYACYPTV
jgi:hypothetical protein